MTLGAFAVVIALNRGGAELVDLNDYAGLIQRQPGLTHALALFMFALTGFPPLAGFVGKWYIFDLAVRNGWAWLAVVGAVASVISAGYYLYVVVLMYMRPAPDDAPLLGDSRGPAGVAVALTLIGTVLLGIFASPIFGFAQATLLAAR
jgi:NADH-quinone oxidoreductase subunit N